GPMSARVTTRILAPMLFQSSKFTASGFRAEIAARLLSGTKSKRPSNWRSLRSTSVIVRQAATVASSARRGPRGGAGKRAGGRPQHGDRQRGADAEEQEGATSWA